MAQQLQGPATKFDNLIQFLLTTQQKERTDICKLSFDLHMCLKELITTALSQGNVTLKKYSVPGGGGARL